MVTLFTWPLFYWETTDEPSSTRTCQEACFALLMKREDPGCRKHSFQGFLKRYENTMNTCNKQMSVMRVTRNIKLWPLTKKNLIHQSNTNEYLAKRQWLIYVAKYSLRSNCSIAKCFPKKSGWCCNKQVCQWWSVMWFEPFWGLNKLLYENFPLHTFT